MTLDPIKLGVFILAFVPGFIYIQVVDHYLLKSEKTQFEKTFQIILASTLIWLGALAFPYLFPAIGARNQILDIAKKLLIEQRDWNQFFTKLLQNTESLIVLFFTVCLWSFIISNLWGMFRRIRPIDRVIRGITRRDWYSTVALRFFDENIDNDVLVTTVEGKRYVGILNGAPDDKNDNAIILVDPHFVEKTATGYELTKLMASSILITTEQIKLIEVTREKRRG